MAFVRARELEVMKFSPPDGMKFGPDICYDLGKQHTERINGRELAIPKWERVYLKCLTMTCRGNNRTGTVPRIH